MIFAYVLQSLMVESSSFSVKICRQCCSPGSLLAGLSISVLSRLAHCESKEDSTELEIMRRCHVTICRSTGMSALLQA